MIPGFNNDVLYRGYKFHVQTEDKGPKNPVIETLLFFRGMIVSSRKTPYDGLLGDENLSEKVRLLMIQQHQKMIADLKRGEFDEIIMRELGEKEEIPRAPVVEEDLSQQFLEALKKIKKVYLVLEEVRVGEKEVNLKVRVKTQERADLSGNTVEVFLKFPDGKKLFLTRGHLNSQGETEISFPFPKIERPFILILETELKGLGFDEKWVKVD